jgi:hypothetical protein
VQAQNDTAPSVDVRDRVAKAILQQAEQGAKDALAIEQAGLIAVLGDVE